jgi:hypothetical protein
MVERGWGWLGVAALLAGTAAFQAKEYQKLRWLTGCWEARKGDQRIVEQWTDSRGGLLLGTSRTFRAGRVVEFEFSAIIPDSDGKLEYQAYPGHKLAASFALAALTDTSISFTNPKHDFPATITYARRGSDSVVAWIEGSSDGGPKRILFPYKRMVCDNREPEDR